MELMIQSFLYNFEIIECILNSNTKKDIDGRKFYILMKKNGKMEIIKRKFIISILLPVKKHRVN